MIQPHAFTPSTYNGAPLLRCDLCARFAGDPLHVLTLPGFETVTAERDDARGISQAEELTAIMRSSRGTISGKAGRMEREAPLFFGTGSNPLLF